MKRFYRDSHVISQSLPENHKDLFEPAFSLMDKNLAQRGALNDISSCRFLTQHSFSSRFHNPSTLDWSDLKGISFSRRFTRVSLSNLHHSWLKDMYAFIYPQYNEDEFVIPSNGLKTCELYR